MYFITSRRHAALYSSTLIFLPISSLVMPSSFSTPSSTGKPWVSQPALRFTWNPCMVLKRQKVSLIVRAITWWIPGIPFAEGGPSKNKNEGLPSRVSILLWNKSSFSHCSRICLLSSAKFSCLYSLKCFILFIMLLFINKLQAHTLAACKCMCINSLQRYKKNRTYASACTIFCFCVEWELVFLLLEIC